MPINFEIIYPQIIVELMLYCPERTMTLTGLTRYRYNESCITYYREKYKSNYLAKILERNMSKLSHNFNRKRSFILHRSVSYPNMLAITYIDNKKKKIYRFSGNIVKQYEEYKEWKKYLLGKGYRFMRVS